MMAAVVIHSTEAPARRCDQSTPLREALLELLALQGSVASKYLAGSDRRSRRGHPVARAVAPGPCRSADHRAERATADATPLARSTPMLAAPPRTRRDEPPNDPPVMA